jgi:hypothetical protein
VLDSEKLGPFAFDTKLSDVPRTAVCIEDLIQLSKRDAFLLRIDSAIMAALKKWAADDLRSLNGQLEFLLRNALRDANRLPKVITELEQDSTNSDEPQ